MRIPRINAVPYNQQNTVSNNKQSFGSIKVLRDYVTGSNYREFETGITTIGDKFHTIIEKLEKKGYDVLATTSQRLGHFFCLENRASKIRVHKSGDLVGGNFHGTVEEAFNTFTQMLTKEIGEI